MTHKTTRWPTGFPGCRATARPNGQNVEALRITLDPKGPEYPKWLAMWAAALSYAEKRDLTIVATEHALHVLDPDRKPCPFCGFRVLHPADGCPLDPHGPGHPSPEGAEKKVLDTDTDPA